MQSHEQWTNERRDKVTKSIACSYNKLSSFEQIDTESERFVGENPVVGKGTIVEDLGGGGLD